MAEGSLHLIRVHEHLVLDAEGRESLEKPNRAGKLHARSSDGLASLFDDHVDETVLVRLDRVGELVDQRLALIPRRLAPCREGCAGSIDRSVDVLLGGNRYFGKCLLRGGVDPVARPASLGRLAVDGVVVRLWSARVKRND